MNKNRFISQIFESGTKRWYLDDQLHRENGPAIEYVDGHKEWWYCGKCHRLDGPAIEDDMSGTKLWFYHGERIYCSSQEEFERLIKLKALW